MMGRWRVTRRKTWGPRSVQDLQWQWRMLVLDLLVALAARVKIAPVALDRARRCRDALRKGLAGSAVDFIEEDA